jgi:hypothetical protein
MQWHCWWQRWWRWIEVDIDEDGATQDRPTWMEDDQWWRPWAVVQRASIPKTKFALSYSITNTSVVPETCSPIHSCTPLGGWSKLSGGSRERWQNPNSCVRYVFGASKARDYNGLGNPNNMRTRKIKLGSIHSTRARHAQHEQGGGGACMYHTFSYSLAKWWWANSLYKVV